MSKPRTQAPSAGWKCPSCRRSFTQINQRHACGTGDRSQVLRNRSPELVRLYEAVEAFARSLGPIEIVARDRYVLLRTTRIFADLVIMTDAVRVAVHLRRPLTDALFFKVVSDGKKVTGVTKLTTEKELQRLLPYLKEAYEASLG
jgi:predicted transport protein